MSFDIWFGIPEIRDFWLNLKGKVDTNKANKNEKRFYKKLLKVLTLLQKDPKHNSLKTHEINILSQRYGRKVWESYLENNKPAAGRIFWVYYPPGGITIVAIEPHLDDKKHSHETITLSSTNVD